MDRLNKIMAFVAFAFLGIGTLVTGCKSAPPLSKVQALALIQAKYDAMPAAPFTIAVDNRGMEEGVIAKYWVGEKRYPNGYWADFKLTPDGKKVLTLANGGDEIQWRPESPTDQSYAISINTVAPTRLKARDIDDILDTGSGTKTAVYTEDVVLTGIPESLQGIADNPGNQISTQRTATFVLTNDAWKLQSIQ